MSVELRTQFMDDKCLYDSICQAIRLAKKHDIEDSKIKPLLLAKQRDKKAMSEWHKRLLKQMPLSKNVLHLRGSWYAIRYLTEKSVLEVKIELIKDTDISLLMRDGRHERELQRKDLEDLIPALIDEEALAIYKQSLQAKAKEILYEYAGILGIEEGDAREIVNEESATTEEDNPVTVSAHAGVRYIQRRLGIKNEVSAEEYRRKNLAEVNEAVLDSFGNASKVWEDADGITYWFNQDNIMHVVGVEGGNPNIITIYEEDFGFDKSINRMIVDGQLQVLSKVREELTEVEAHSSDINSRVNQEIQGINDEITMLESQVALLVSKRAKLSSDKELHSRQVKAVKDRYVAEFNKLFKKWDA